MKNNKILRIVFLMTLLSALEFSCSKGLNIEDIELGKPEYALPLTDVRTSIKKLLGDYDTLAFLRIDSDSMMTAHYKGSLLTRSSIDLFGALQNALYPIPDTTVGIPYLLPNNARMEFVDLKTGKFAYAGFLFGQFAEPLLMTIRVPQMTKNGVPFQWSFTMTPSLSGNLDSVDVSGYRITPINDSIWVHYEARRTTNNERVRINNFVIGMRGMQMKYAQGYMGVNTFDAPRDSIRLDIFKSWTTGEVTFENPKITVSLDNSFGIPVKSVTREAFIVSATGRQLPLESPFITNGVNIAYPTLNEVGQSKRTVLVYDKSTSNLVDIIAAGPVAMVYDIDGVTQEDPTRSLRSFITDSSTFRLQVEMDLPLHARAKGFMVRDTVNVDFQSLKNIEYAEFKMIADNGMPIDLSVQGYFLGESGQVLDSLFQSAAGEPLLRGAAVNANGDVTRVTQQISYIPIDAPKLNRIRLAKRLALRYSLATSNNGATPSVRLKSNQDVRIQLGVSVGLK